MMWINGKNRTHFAGSWTILSTSFLTEGSCGLLTWLGRHARNRRVLRVGCCVSARGGVRRLPDPCHGYRANIVYRYPFNDDEAAKRLFVLTLLANHGVRMRKEHRKGFLF